MAKDKDNNNVMSDADGGALMTVNENDRQVATAAPSQFTQGVALTREALEIVEEFQSLSKAVEAGFATYTKPSDLAAQDVVFDITDAWHTTFTNDKGVEEPKICFTLVEQDSGIVHTVMQSDDSKGIRRKYATLYSRAKALGIPTEPLRGYMFVETEKTFAAGNKAYVLQRAPVQIPANASR